MQLAVEGKVADPDFTDFVMSTRFGLDWKEYDGIRMAKFVHMISCEAKRDQKQQEKAARQNESSRSRRSHR